MGFCNRIRAEQKRGVSRISGIEVVNMLTNRGSDHLNKPQAQASRAASTCAILGRAETRQLTEMLASILNQAGADARMA